MRREFSSQARRRHHSKIHLRITTAVTTTTSRIISAGPVDGRRKITDNRDNQNEKTNKPRLLAVDRRPPN